MSDKNKLVTLLDQIGDSPSKDDLLSKVTSLIRILQSKDTEAMDSLHKSPVILPTASPLDYALKRSINGSAIESLPIQRNYLLTTLGLLTTFQSSIPLKPLIHFILEICGQPAAVNKTEKQFFAFASITLLFKVYDLWADVDDKTVFNRVTVHLVDLVTKNSFAKSFLAGALDNTSFYDSFHVNLVDKIVGSLNVASHHDLELLVKLKVDCLEAWKKMNDPPLQKTIAKVATELNHKLRDAYSAKALLKLFEVINKDPNFQDDSKVPLIYGKLAQLYLSHKDLKAKQVFELFNLITKSDKSHSAANYNKLAHFSFFFGELLGNLPHLDQFLSQVDGLEARSALDAIFQANLGSQGGRSVKQLAASANLQSKLVSNLSGNSETSQAFQLYLLRLIHSRKDLSAARFPLKDALLHTLDNLPVKLTILDDLTSQLTGLTNITTLRDFKALLNKIGALLPSVASSPSSQTTIESLFATYSESKSVAESLTDELKDHSDEFITREVRTAVYQKLFQLVFRKCFRKILPNLVEKWMKINNCEDEFGNLSSANDLFGQQNKKAESLSQLNLVLLFQNYQETDEDLESLVFNQSTEDVAVFSQNYLTSEGKLDASDFKILTDVLISLLNCQSHEIREIVNSCFEAFLHLLDESVFALLEETVFKDDKIQSQPSEESEDEGDMEVEGEGEDDGKKRKLTRKR